MADAIVSVVLEQLAAIARQHIQQEVTLVGGVNKAVKRLTSNFQAIQAVLVDAEQRQVKETSVRVWLEKLKDVSYNAENVLDEWNTTKLKLQIQRAESALTLKKKVCSFFLSSCFCFRQVVLHHDIALKVKQINESLDDISKEKDRFNFNMIGRVEQSQRVESISLIDESKIYGRDKEKDILVNKLCESTDEKEGIQIISLVGMGGIGKTTLAQLVYNNNEVKKSFEKRMWIYVSDAFDVLKVAKAIVVALECPTSELVNLESYVQKISESIGGKKFLLVLDDVWIEDHNAWEPLHQCLRKDPSRSKILVTTRKQTVAHMMDSTDVIPIMELSEEHCWSMFKCLAFSGRSKVECRELEDIGREIVSKCKGFPLAAKTMGSLLRFKRTRNEWKSILDSKMWVLKEFERDIFRVLMLSYNELPPMVKRCFSYCAIFPKDYQLDKDELIKLWMAHGYLELEQNKEIEMIGEDYFNILGTRSFFQEFMKDDIGNIIRCKMHDVVHDFAQFLTKNECFAIKDNEFKESSINNSFEKACHLLFMVDKNSSFPITTYNIKKLRTLLIQFELDSHSVDIVLLKLLGQNTCLRALAMAGTTKFDMMTGWYNLDLIRFGKLPREIGKLIHLRYLDLSKNEGLEMLPETLCELYNLQTLDISNCKNLNELPQGMGKLINLRHLVNEYTHSLRYMPKGIEKLTCLRTLKEFHVSYSDYSSKACLIDCLNQFCHLKGYLGIKGLGNLTNVSEARRIQLTNKENIYNLSLDFSGPNSENNEAILEALQPPPNLLQLRISKYVGTVSLPIWMTSITNLRRICLIEWINCQQLPPLGKVSSLESIYIRGMKSVKRVGNELLGLESNDITGSSSSLSFTAFPKLKSLKFNEMEEWEGWDFGNEDDDITIMFSCLRLLEIRDCRKLKVLPNQILQAPLEVLSIDQCTILRDRYRKGTSENWSDISHIPNIKIDGQYVQRDGIELSGMDMYLTPEEPVSLGMLPWNQT